MFANVSDLWTVAALAFGGSAVGVGCAALGARSARERTAVLVGGALLFVVLAACVLGVLLAAETGDPKVVALAGAASWVVFGATLFVLLRRIRSARSAPHADGDFPEPLGESEVRLPEN